MLGMADQKSITTQTSHGGNNRHSTTYTLSAFISTTCSCTFDPVIPTWFAINTWTVYVWYTFYIFPRLLPLNFGPTCKLLF